MAAETQARKTEAGTALEAACRARGLRITGQRKTILDVLATSPDHPDAPELHRRAMQRDPDISLSTVYRTVKLLQDRGILDRHAFRDGRARYEAAGRAHHDHLINLKTGKVLEFRSEEIEKLQAEVARKLGFRLVDHRLELYAVPLDEED